MKVTNTQPVIPTSRYDMSKLTLQKPLAPHVQKQTTNQLKDHDGTEVWAPCMSRVCYTGHAHMPPLPTPPAPPVLIDHDGIQFPPKPGGPGHGRA